MKSSSMVALALVGAFGLMAPGCDVPEDAAADDSKQIAVVTAALNETGLTTNPATARPAMASASDRSFVVWVASDSMGTQIVGQMFSQDGKVLNAPKVYHQSTHVKQVPSVAFDGSRFLVVYQDTYMPGDDDILCFATDLNGTEIGMAPNINFTGLYDAQPQVVWDQGRQKFVVSYIENAGAGLTRIVANTTNLATVSAPVTVTTSTTSYHGSLRMAGGDSQVLLTWRGNDNGVLQNSFMFLPAGPNLTAGTSQVLATSTTGGFPSVGFNSQVNQFALSWRDRGSSGWVSKFRGFPRSCQSLACATAERSPIANYISQLGAPSDLGDPVLVGYDIGFGIFVGNLNAFPGLKPNVQVKWVDAAGIVGANRFDALPVCTGTQNGMPSISSGSALSPSLGHAYAAIVSNCSSSNVVAGLHFDTSFASSRFPISN